MSNTSISIARPARMLLAVLGIALISGCTTYPKSNAQPAQYVLNNDPATLLQDESLNEFLSKSPAGAVLNVGRSPWGHNVEIVADAPYLAASGRECRKLRVVEMGSTARTALVCQTPNGWVNQRVVTQIDSSATQGRY
ncbi:DVU3141 family protein [Vreelandella nanhaiensis]|uniref:Common-antigen outer membrane protein n=1 Tax=Vreelandella nanhaiensis TaxID=1258546 RepID=A0A433KRL5_9GAMM|nr:DVU3141 family protein [Halomonas nanhaiensis]RUR32222.1 hypothetical protein ELY38_07905 [Halomonas nanhaiensis]